MILNTRGYTEPVETLVEKLSSLLGELGADVSAVENLGHRDFVSGAVKKHAGDIFLLYTFSGDPSIPAIFQEKLRLDTTIKRLHVNLI